MNEDYYTYIKKLYERWAPFYDIINPFISGIREKVVEITSAGSGSKILDVCSGTGEQAFAFARKGYDVIGIDLSEDMLKVAKKKNKYKNVKFEVADATNIPYEDNYFDVSCISFGLHEMPLDIREEVVKEMVRVTKPKGIIVVLDYALPKNKIAKFLAYRFIKSYESKYYSEFIKSDFKILIGKYGIKIEKEIPVLLRCGKILMGMNEK